MLTIESGINQGNGDIFACRKLVDTLEIAHKRNVLQPKVRVVVAHRFIRLDGADGLDAVILLQGLDDTAHCFAVPDLCNNCRQAKGFYWPLRNLLQTMELEYFCNQRRVLLFAGAISKR